MASADEDVPRTRVAAVVPGLAALDPADPTLLPDGSRWVDARALAIVCEHLGAQEVSGG